HCDITAANGLLAERNAARGAFVQKPGDFRRGRLYCELVRRVTRRILALRIGRETPEAKRCACGFASIDEGYALLVAEADGPVSDPRKDEASGIRREE